MAFKCQINEYLGVSLQQMHTVIGAVHEANCLPRSKVNLLSAGHCRNAQAVYVPSKSQATYISAPEVGGDVDRRQGRLVDLCVVVGVDAHLLPPEMVVIMIIIYMKTAEPAMISVEL